jgi:hypothetical protein
LELLQRRTDPFDEVPGGKPVNSLALRVEWPTWSWPKMSNSPPPERARKKSPRRLALQPLIPGTNRNQSAMHCSARSARGKVIRRISLSLEDGK